MIGPMGIADGAMYFALPIKLQHHSSNGLQQPFAVANGTLCHLSGVGLYLGTHGLTALTPNYGVVSLEIACWLEHSGK